MVESKEETPVQEQSNSYLAESSLEQVQDVNILERLFANDNQLLTAHGSSLSITEETRRLLALFSDGTYFVSKDHRFDGLVYNFEKTIKRRKIKINEPQYVSQNEINAIYAYAERGSGVAKVGGDERELMQIQIDFINIVARAASQKVSDVHAVVADSTIVLFRINGMMVRQMEYNKEWGESFVRAVFASSDISDSAKYHIYKDHDGCVKSKVL